MGGHEPYNFPNKRNLPKVLKDILEEKVDEKFYLSEEQVNRIKISNFAQEAKRIQEKDWCDTLLARDYKDPKCVKVEPKIIQVGRMDTEKFGGNPQVGRVYDKNGISPTLNTMQGGRRQPMILNNEVDSKYSIRKLTPKECWRLMGVSDGDFEKAEKVNSNSQLYKQAGNAIVVDVLEGIFSSLFKVC